MNYAAHYGRLIERARGRIIEGYKEKHHVVPRCMGGGNEPLNIVELTGEEHYVAHQLLVWMFPDVCWLALAAFRMAKQCTGNKAYGWLRRRMAKEQAKAMMGVRRTGRPVSQETRDKTAATLRGRKIAPEIVEKTAAAHRGRPLSAEHRAKISLSNKITKRKNLENRKPRTHCKQGHQLVQENVYVRRNHGSILCRTCRTINRRLYWEQYGK